MSEEGDYSLVHFLEREQTKENTLAAYKAGLEAGAARAASKWISVKERLPKNFGEYYVFVKNHRVELACFNGEEWSLAMTDGAGLEGDITHWMPLPAAPEVERCGS